MNRANVRRFMLIEKEIRSLEKEANFWGDVKMKLLLEVENLRMTWKNFLEGKDRHEKSVHLSGVRRLLKIARKEKNAPPGFYH